MRSPSDGASSGVWCVFVFVGRHGIETVSGAKLLLNLSGLPGLGHSLTATHSLASLTRAPSLRSVAVLRCAQSPSFAALSPWLRHAAGSACGLFVFEAGVS